MTILLFFLGASIASFLTLIIYRFPDQSIIAPASHCDSCQTKIKWYDLIPILSQLSTKFSCRYCQSHVPIWFTIYELICGFLVIFWWKGYLTLTELVFWLISSLLCLFDLKNQAYPLIIWVILEIYLLSNTAITSLLFFLLGGALLCHLFPLKIGAGDLLYLASLSHFLTLTEMLYLIQIASLVAIFFAIKKPKQSLPFLPFLFGAYLLLWLK